MGYFYLVDDSTGEVLARSDGNYFNTDDGESVVEDETYHEVNGLTYDGSNFKVNPEYRLSTDATDDHEPEQGVPDIPADGTTSATITIQKYSGKDNKLTGSSHDDTVYVEATRGKLSSMNVSLTGGSATVELQSVQETVVSEIEAYSPDGAVRSGTIQIQFTPES